MPFFLRIGPWAHGEVRNGGFPDWLLQKCGGLKITVYEREVSKPKPIRALSVKTVEKTVPDTAFAHLQNRDGTPLEQTEAVEYQVDVPENTSYLAIKAVGNIAALYDGERLLSDFYLYGDTWYVDVRELAKPAKLTLKVLPFTENDRKKVYLEIHMPVGITLAQVFATTI